MSTDRPKLTVWEKAALSMVILKTLGHGFFTLLTGPFRGDAGSPKLKDHVILSMIRYFVMTLDERQYNYLTPSIHDAYPTFAKKRGFDPRSETMPSGNKAYWIGDPHAEKLMIWFHGGGYNLPIGPGHLPFFATIVEATHPDSSLAVLAPAYTLAPHATYPSQLRQAAEVLHHVLTTLHKPPQNIILAGDSAGGNLALGLISHLLHPHPEIPPIKLPQPLKALILMSPWASFSTDWPSGRANAQKDLVSAASGDNWSRIFLGGRERDAWNEPLAAPRDWWLGLEETVQEVLVLAGSDELLADAIGELGGRLKAAHSRTTTFIARGEWHEAPVIMVPRCDGGSRDVILGFCKKMS